MCQLSSRECNSTLVKGIQHPFVHSSKTGTKGTPIRKPAASHIIYEIFRDGRRSPTTKTNGPTREVLLPKGNKPKEAGITPGRIVNQRGSGQFSKSRGGSGLFQLLFILTRAVVCLCALINTIGLIIRYMINTAIDWPVLQRNNYFILQYTTNELKEFKAWNNSIISEVGKSRF